MKKLLVSKCVGEGLSSCKRCLENGKWNRVWHCFLYHINGFDGCYYLATSVTCNICFVALFLSGFEMLHNFSNFCNFCIILIKKGCFIWLISQENGC